MAGFETEEFNPDVNSERRMLQRRVIADRRASIRFNIEKPNRRSGRDRRADNNIWADQMRWGL
ncbi:MAG: hypothetical protein D6B27_11835 [Gammaproteobacteria bacterium]|nr:MAG: hypothetical protein D6B27_11835 [Gammaproteobacteria bacterium]